MRYILTKVAKIEGAEVTFANGYTFLTCDITEKAVNCSAIVYTEDERVKPKILGFNLVELKHNKITFLERKGPVGLVGDSTPIPKSTLEFFRLETDTFEDPRLSVP